MQMLRKVFLGISEKNKQKFKKNFAKKRKILLIFGGFYGKKELKKALFLKFFQEILMSTNAMNKHSCFHTAPGVSRKNLKKVLKKVLT